MAVLEGLWWVVAVPAETMGSAAKAFAAADGISSAPWRLHAQGVHSRELDGELALDELLRRGRVALTSARWVLPETGLRYRHACRAVRRS